MFLRIWYNVHSQTEIPLYYVYSKALLDFYLPDASFSGDVLLVPPNTYIDDTVITGYFANFLSQPQLENTPLKLTTAIQALEKDE